MIPLLLAALQGITITASRSAAADTVPPVADAADHATAYVDEGARELVRLARGHRGAIDAEVFRYTAVGRQRISVGLRALRRDRLLYRRETASRIDWRRDAATRIEVIGAREVVPVASAGVRVPGELERWARGFVPRPGDDRLFVNPMDDGFAWHPLAEGSEALYRFATGDTTTIRLPEGRSVRLVELRVTPRERDVRVVTGSFWIELENHGIVQAVFRPARSFDLDRDADASDVPGILKPVRFDVRYITIEYGFWEMRWWMPRLMLFDGSLQVGPAHFPIAVELTYADYDVQPDRYGLPELPPVTIRLAGDPEARPGRHRHPTVVTVADTATLLHGPALPANIYATAERLVSEHELRELADRLALLPPTPWTAGRPAVAWPWSPGGGLLRYNRVEGLAPAVRVDWDLGRARLDLTGRVGLAELEPDVEVGADIPSLRRRWRVAGYHRLAASNPEVRPFRFANSASALLWGSDDGMYFRSTGAEIRLDAAPGEPRYQARVHAERQRAAPPGTDFSLRQAMGGRGFRPNMDADPADQVGLAAKLGIHRGLDPGRARWGGRLELLAETGTYTFVRPGITAEAAVPLPGGFVWVAEIGAGTTLGSGPGSPIQSHWYLGGPATLRGLPGGALSGPDHGRGRLELGSALPGARLVLFSDAGWAGEFERYDRADVAVSAGAGVSLLDGLLRADLARVVRPSPRWRLELYLDALL